MSHDDILYYLDAVACSMKTNLIRRLLNLQHCVVELITFIGLISCSPLIMSQSTSINSPQRLSQIITPSTPESNLGDRNLQGLMWNSPAELKVQELQKAELLNKLSSIKTNNDRFPNVLNGITKLEQFIQQLPVTGRVLLPQQDPRWLEVHPKFDPVLTPKDLLKIPENSRWVTVIRDDGRVCQLPFRSKVYAAHYTTLCDIKDDALSSWAWVIQADGTYQKVGLSSWNQNAQKAPSPGSWIWAPSSPKLFRQTIDALPWTAKRHFNDDFSESFAAFLATQGPSDAKSLNTMIKPDRSIIDSPLMLVESQKNEPRDLQVTASDWGSIGLLQTPTARMLPAGSGLINYTHVTPYTNYNFLLQPFENFETAFRYTTDTNHAYGSFDLSGNQSYLDKSIDFKLRLLEENAVLPQMAIGIRDATGTGLFSGEYLVANKRYNNFDFSLGLAWGYMGNRGNVKNPLSIFGSGFSTRPIPDVGQGGNFSFGTYFHGPTALIGGVQYQTPISRLSLKLELDGNNYQNEPFGDTLPQRIPFNFGAVYRWDNANISVGIERGNTAMISVSFFDNLSKLSTPKLSEPAPIPVSYQPIQSPFGVRNIDPQQTEVSLSQQDKLSAAQQSTTNQTKRLNDDQEPTRLSGSDSANSVRTFDIDATKSDILQQSGWRLRSIQIKEKRWVATVDDVDGVYFKDRIDRVIRVLHRDAPNTITTFELRLQNHQLKLTKQIVNRQAWMLKQQQLLPPSYAALSNPQPEEYSGYSPSIRLFDANSRQNNTSEIENKNQIIEPNGTKPWSASTGLGFQQNIGGPNGYLFAFLGVANASLRLWEGAWVNGALNYRLLDNYENFTYDAPSNLPRVRTNLREYLTTSRITMPNLQATQVVKLGDSHYFSAYGGMLESMFGGVGGEWLYRPQSSSIAVGIDVNQVRQRDFNQRFTFQDYQVFTGHLTTYWQTGWQDVLIKASAGQYLAGDRGVTLDLSRSFANGVRMGAYATKTNVSAADFGEGSFDKGIYVAIPFDAFFTKHTSETANLLWAPLIRDGGAKLYRQYPLYDLTKIRDDRVMQFGPPQ
jgi:Exopolysaccharide biosynthesis protein YbjH/Capsule biosynthesis GfcC